MTDEKGRFRLLIADDEPMAVKALTRVIEKNCPDFSVVGTAQNGQEALELIEKTDPDLVLTDIAMPVMNGLELAARARKVRPDLHFVVISGYQDYEYMRNAIQNGVLDYLAKPIVPSNIQEVMERIEGRLKEQLYISRNRLIRALGQGEEICESELNRYFPYGSFYAALLRENGLPRRFTREAEPELYGNLDEAFSVYGRDSMEELFLIPAPLLGEQTLLSYMEKIRARQQGQGSYTTLLYYGKPFSKAQIPEKIKALYHALNAFSTVGLTQSIDLDRLEGAQLPAIPRSPLLESFLLDLPGLVKAGRSDVAEKRFRQLLDSWVKEQRSQIWMEQAVRQVLQIIRAESKGFGPCLECEYHLEDAFYYAAGSEMLYASLRELLFPCAEAAKTAPKADSPEYFAGIEDYLHAHLSEQISLQELSDQFAISQAYMSRLFRKYADKSFSQYLTEIRMERAKSCMEENRDLYVKDIALMVGYRDQFYFSRIFRSYTGKSPADYLRSC